MEKSQHQQTAICAFCKKPEEEVGLLIGKKHIKICNLCALSYVDKFNQIMEKEISEKDYKGIKVCPSPYEIKKELDDFVVGQEEAKRSLAVAFYNHCLRFILDENDDGIGSRKSNIMVIGPTGSGKTLSLQVLSSFFNIPFINVDVNRFSETGYYGDDVEDIIFELFNASENNAVLTEGGVIYIDEIDKIRRLDSGTRDVSGEGVQNALLKIMEGTIVSVPVDSKNKNRSRKFIDIDTRNILFVFGGAFVGLEKIVASRLKRGEIGFRSGLEQKDEQSNFELLKQANAKDFIKYGFIPEFIGRIGKRAVFNNLDEALLLRALSEPRHSLLSEFQRIFYTNNIKLIFNSDALEEIACLALKEETGARGLRNVLERILEPLMFDLFSDPKLAETCVITRNFVLGTEDAFLE